MDLDRRLSFVVVAACWVVVALHLARLQPWTVDDAYIVFRYAENWVAGHGPVYNPGEWVEGYTSPLWLLLLAAAHALGLPTELASKGLGVAAALAVLLVLARAEVVAPVSSRAGALAAVLAGTSGAALAWSGGGLEATLAGLLSVGAWLGHLGGRPWAVPLSALAPLVRPELLLIPFVQAADHLVARRWRSAGVLVAATVGVGGGHELLRLWAYGWPLPNPFYAKVGATGDQVARGAEYLRRYLMSGGPVLLFALLGATDRRSRPLVAWIALHVGFVVAVGGDGLPAWRLFVPLVPTAALCAGLWLERSLRGWAVPVAALAAGWQLAAIELDPKQAPRAGGEAVAVAGREVGTWLRDQFPPETVIATNAAGALPYFSGFVAIDTLGLCDETIAHTPSDQMGTGMAGHEKANGAYVLSRAPELVLFGSARGRRTPKLRSDHSLAASPGFHERYVFETYRLPSGGQVSLYRRRDAPRPRGAE